MGKIVVLESASDMGLVEIARGGDRDAFAELWKRHSAAIMNATRAYTSLNPDDIVQETFLRIWEQIRSGNGPRTSFRAYAITTARSIASNMGRSKSNGEVTGMTDDVLDALIEPEADTADRVLSDSLTVSVFESLPSRWKEVLWYRDVEDLSIYEVALYMGLKENATSALLKRAREGFKQAWIAANLEPESGISEECKWVIERLPQFTRGRSTATAKLKIEAHLSTCTRCVIIAEESNELHRRLALVLLPALLGGPAALGYRQWITTGDNRRPEAAQVSPPAASLQSVGRLTQSGTRPVALVSIGAVAVSLLSSTLSVPPMSPSAFAPTTSSPENVATGSENPTGTVRQYTEGNEQSEEEVPPELSQPLQGAAPSTSRESVPTDVRDEEVVEEAETIESTPRLDGDIDVPVITPVALSAAPVDGTEDGIYPNLYGTGMPGADIHVTVTNEIGDVISETTHVDAGGSWDYKVHSLRGTLTVSAFQSYQIHGSLHTENPQTLGFFKVGDGLRMTITPDGPNQSKVRATNFGPSSKNQVLNLSSDRQGRIVAKQPLTSSGTVEMVIPYAVDTLGKVVFWAGDTSEGPRRFWQIQPGVSAEDT